MKELIISGASDDLIDVDGAVQEECCVYDVPAGGVPLYLHVDQRVLATVMAYYNGYWSFAFLGTVDDEGGEAVTMPDGWRVEVRAAGDREGDVAPCSMSLHVFVPDACPVRVRFGAGDAA